jgi:hypothetical protein
VTKATYRRKTYTVEAEQWDGKPAPGINVYYMGKSFAEVSSDQATVIAHLDPETSPLHPGDYVIHGEGGRYVVDRRTFEDTYELVTEVSNAQS